MKKNTNALTSAPISRRALIGALGAGALAVTSLPNILRAQAAKQETPETMTDNHQGAGFYQFRIGIYHLTLISDGGGQAEPSFLFPKVPTDELNTALHDQFMNQGKVPLQINALLIRGNGRTILVDTGVGPDGLPNLGLVARHLKRLDLDETQIDTVFITHMHGDHIGGLLNAEGGIAYPNAKVLINEREYDFWNGNPDLSQTGIPEVARKNTIAKAQNVSKVYEGRWEFLNDDAEIAPGIKLIFAPGHTPGHSGLEISSREEKMIYIADTVHVVQLQAPHPNWHIAFDTFPVQAAKTRNAILKRAADERLYTSGSHLPFPANGHFRAVGDAYQWQPIIWRWVVPS
ncbi:MBL fold metallo-hydrolase [Poriferisphaera sp. WC338]|uniref:MBL fold metallo-hydrolase n=1 Tax=Poriferisphaera sp. WC338 TaxID=3425129 RepID=UPI003D817515